MRAKTGKSRSGSNRSIGVIFNTIRYPNQARILDGIRQYAGDTGVNLFLFDAASCDEAGITESARNYFCALPGKRVVDGLLVLPGVLCRGTKNPNTMIRRFHPLPLATVDWKTAGTPAVTLDDESGVAALVSHLAGLHNCKKIVFLSRVAASPAAKKLATAFFSALETNSLKPDRRLFINNPDASGLKRALHDLRTKNDPGYDAVITDTKATAKFLLAKPAGRSAARAACPPFAVLEYGPDDAVPSPEWITLGAPYEDMGAKALKFILSILSPKPATPVKTQVKKIALQSWCECHHDMSFMMWQNRLRSFPVQALRDTEDNLLLTRSRQDLKKTIETDFPTLGISECYCLLWDGEKKPLHYSRIVAGFSGKRKISATQFPDAFLTNRLLPSALLPIRDTKAFIVEPIFDHDRFIGMLIFSLNDPHPGLPDILRRAVKNGLARIKFEQETGSIRSASESEVGRLSKKILDLNQKLQKEKRTVEKLSSDLARSKLQYKRWFEDDFTGDFIAQADGRITACNNAFAHMFGFASARDAIDANFGDFYPHKSSLEDFYTLLGVVRRIEYYESEFVRKDGTTIHVIGNILGMFDHDNNLVEMQGFLFDNTERKHLEEELRHAHKMDAIGKLAGGIAHDFNNILTGIMGYAELLLSKIPKSDPSQKEVDEIKKAAKSAASLTRQLLAFSRKQILKPMVLDLNEVVRNMRDLLIRVIGEHISLVTELDSSLSAVKADRGQIEQVIMNLVLNSRDALPDGGSIVLITRNRIVKDEQTSDVSTSIKAGPYVVLEVCDNGIGMDLETQTRIFEPFFTTKKPGQGVGLGLSTVYGIVSQSGGFTEVTSEAHRGTIMRVYLPQYTAVVEAREEPLPYQEDVKGNATILLVEDEQMVRDTAEKTLTAEGYHVITAHNAQEALGLVKKHILEFDLVISDIVMPGMSGIELGQKIQAMRPGIKILLMSGYDDRMLNEQGKYPFMKNFIPKPFAPEVLLRKVQDIISG